MNFQTVNGRNLLKTDDDRRLAGVWLAKVCRECAIERAKLAHLPLPEEGVMQALKEAIDERAATMVRLAFDGRVESAEYRNAENQLRRWNSAWRRNR